MVRDGRRTAERAPRPIRASVRRAGCRAGRRPRSRHRESCGKGIRRPSTNGTPRPAARAPPVRRRESAAREQRQHDERARRQGEPERRGRRVRLVAPTRRPRHALERRERRSGRRAVAARKRAEVSRAERTPAVRAWPPTRVGGESAIADDEDVDHGRRAPSVETSTPDERTSMTPGQSALGPARIVALALFALAVLGLAYLRFTPGATRSRSRPARAPGSSRSTPVTTRRDGSYAADCGTLVVPENRHDRESRLIALPVTRIPRARRTPARRLPPPGRPRHHEHAVPDASRFAGQPRRRARGLPRRRRLVEARLPRGASTRAARRDFLTAQSYRADAAASGLRHRLQDAGFDLGRLLAARARRRPRGGTRALGYAQVDLLSESAGTRTAMIYAWRYPKRIQRSVMSASTRPGISSGTRRRPASRSAATRLCAQPTRAAAAARPISLRRSTPPPRGSRSAGCSSRQAGQRPARLVLRPDERDTRRRRSALRPVDDRDDARRGHGDASGAWLLSTMAQLVFPRVQVWGDVAAVGAQGQRVARRFFAAQPTAAR